MALGNNNSATFLTIADGKIVRRFQSPTEKSTERVNKNGVTVHEEHYNFLEGHIVGIEAKDGDYGKHWMVTVEDGTDRYVLQMNYSSGYSAAFLKQLPNVNLAQKVRITPKLTVEGDKKKSTIFLNQGGQPIKWYYTKDNPNGIPQLKQIKVKGVVTWDDSDIMEFLEEMVKTNIVPKLGKKEVSEYAEALPFDQDEKAPF